MPPLHRRDGTPCTRCPAALSQAGPPSGGASVVCRIMVREKREADELTHGLYVSPLIDQRDASILYGFCCGTALPVIDAVPEDGKAHHTACPVWRAEREREHDGRRVLAEPLRREAPGIDPGKLLRTPAGMASELAGPPRMNGGIA